ncbi:NAD(P)H dehydrogenase [anaerobic digester metagenome]|jgi:multimeric flavodoxin WrbA|uniref:NAD(P)H dehydrogenase n=1 Tax=anaerobic digester metagenome TaxID=1263854 RepID=A0A485M111_9ZZZZ
MVLDTRAALDVCFLITKKSSLLRIEMDRQKRVTAIVGTYRKGGIIDAAVDEILASARDQGALAEKIYLTDACIEFCTNCRTCAGQPGQERGRCPLSDDMAGILDKIEQSDALVLASPMNFGTVTAVMKRFIERLICYAYWPWGAAAPRKRKKKGTRRAVVVVSSAAPALLARLTTRITGLLKQALSLMGAETAGVLFIGLAARKPHQDIGVLARRKARILGRKLVQ